MTAEARWLAEAIDLSRRCPPSAGAFSVGAVVVGADGERLASGHSREDDPHAHAEESALGKLAGEPRLAGATLYSSLEPCSVRRSRPRTCTELIVAAGIARVVFAWREPSVLVAECRGAEELAEAGIEVRELPELRSAVIEVNRHLLG